ncbi:uncharacterized protein [Spinacia oleracea]|uniref:Uncharacterized protein n=1 Tax=Spinacia oleracea TaxID=3562 RepID=A0ABM3QPT4_SPIOL|nr:uncharacterized protein LOC130461319 [Spinacia oleracea]
MKDEEDEVRSASSSPIPVSTGPDNLKYSFSSLPAPSPPLSPLGSSNSSTEKLPLLHNSRVSEIKKVSTLSSFSLDQSQSADDSSSQPFSCLLELLEWFALRCCSCCGENLNRPSKLHHN